MPDKLKTFPGDKFEALAMLYVERQDLSNLSSEQIFDLYSDAYDAILYRSKERKEEKHKESRNLSMF